MVVDGLLAVPEVSEFIRPLIELEAPQTTGATCNPLLLYEHSLGVAGYAEVIFDELGLPDEHIRSFVAAGCFHDIAKTALNPGILFGKKALTPEEMKEVEKHSLNGVVILNGAFSDKTSGLGAVFTVDEAEIIKALTAVHHSFKRDKNKSYPNMEEIIRHIHEGTLQVDALDMVLGGLGEVFSVCDAYNSIHINRPYSKQRLKKEGHLDPSKMNAPSDRAQAIGIIVQSEIELSTLGEQALEILIKISSSRN